MNTSLVLTLFAAFTVSSIIIGCGASAPTQEERGEAQLHQTKNTSSSSGESPSHTSDDTTDTTDKDTWSDSSETPPSEEWRHKICAPGDVIACLCGGGTEPTTRGERICADGYSFYPCECE
jgi:hypothetical protein